MSARKSDCPHSTVAASVSHDLGLMYLVYVYAEQEGGMGPVLFRFHCFGVLARLASFG